MGIRKRTPATKRERERARDERKRPSGKHFHCLLFLHSIRVRKSVASICQHPFERGVEERESEGKKKKNGYELAFVDC